MSSVNKAIILGRLGRDPEVRYTQGGEAVANLSVATSERWKDKNGEKQERTEWHRVTLWGRTAEIAGEYLKKGSLCYVEGRLQTRKYTDKDGVERYTTEVVGDQLRLLSGQGGQGGESQQHRPPPSKSSGGGNEGGRQQATDFDDDIPF